MPHQWTRAFGEVAHLGGTPPLDLFLWWTAVTGIRILPSLNLAMTDLPSWTGLKGVTGDSLPVLLSFIVLAMSPSCQIYSVFKPDVLQFGGNLKDHAFQPPHFDCTWLLDTPEGFSPFLLSWDWDSAWVEERWFLCHIYRALFLHTFSPKPIMELPHLDT